MKKNLFNISIFLVCLFALERIGFALFQKDQISDESNIDKVLGEESSLQKMLYKSYYEVVEKNDFKVFTNNFENQLGQDDTIEYLAELKVSQESSSGRDFKYLAEEKSIIERQNDQTKNFNFETGFFLEVPVWLIIVICLSVIYTIFISLKFFSIYFQEVSTKEQLEVITGDFDSYKRNTIEKERKLMRDLIDAKNRINDLSQEIKD